MKTNKEQLASAPIPSLLIKYGIPAILGMVVDAIYNLVDAIFIGQGAGALALGAMTITFPLYLINLGIALCIGLGTASVVSRSLGANQDEKANRAAGNAIGLVIISSIVMTITGMLLMQHLLNIFGCTPEIMPYAVDYLTYIFLATLPFSFTVASNHIIRSEGNAKVAMISGFIFAVMNIILDYLFIFPLDMGIKGASIATLISCVLSSIYNIIYFMRKRGHLVIHRQHLLPDWKLTVEMLKVGTPVMTRLYLASLVGFLVNNSIKWYGDPSYLAVVSIIYRLMTFISLPIYGISNGLQPIIGFNYGSGNLPRVREALKSGIIVSTVISSLFFLFILIFPDLLVSMFTREKILVRIGSPMLVLMLMFFPLYGIQMVGAGFFQAIGRARSALVHMVSTQFLFLPLVLLLPLIWGIDGVWLSYPGAAYLAFILVAVGLFREIHRWKAVSAE
jgi:putative MATE family efflux protein